MKRLPAAFLTCALAAGCLCASSCGGGGIATSPRVAKIGVMLPLTGDRPLDWERVLDWEAAGINSGLEGTGFSVELVYRDTFGVDASDIARELLSDKSLEVAIGPMTSREAMTVAPQFERAGKLLLSPCATSDELFRAFSGRGCFARTCQSDVAQTNTILNILRARGVEKLSLVYEDTTYGRTFLDWTGFLAREMGMELLGVASFAPGQADVSSVVASAAEAGPECILLAAFPSDAENNMRAVDALEPGPAVFSTDAAMQPSFFRMRGAAAEGFEGVTPSGPSDSGFARQYRKVFGREPEAWSAETYDALLLAAATAARRWRAGGTGSVNNAFMDVVTGKQKTCDCTLRGVSATVKEILKGGLPALSGATGPLVFDRRYGVDTVDTYYAHWKVVGGEMELQSVISSDEIAPAALVEPGAPEASALPSPRFMNYQKGMPTGAPSFASRRGLKAVLLASSYGLDRYRHQADALALYHMLRSRGVADDDIVLMMADDVKTDGGNVHRGEVLDRLGGTDLRAGAVVDYSGDEVTRENFRDVLLGSPADGGGPVLRSTADTDVLVFISGDVQGSDLTFSGSPPETPGEFSEVIEKMSESGRCRQLLVLAQLDEGADFCRALRSPRAVAMTASSHGETATPANYDSALHVWLADRFTAAFIQAASRSRNLSVADVYRRVYLESGGAHVSLVNFEDFDVEGTPISDFTR